ncbi:MAG: DUF3592 domain-containing protein [Spirochaetes bacterium]|nr:DUF3592 domain-containing protein [Spirochaetota bacterium]
MKMQDKGSKSRKNNPAILVVALLVFGLILGGFGLYKYKTGKESVSWPSVKGKITYSRVEAGRNNKKQEYLPSVKYIYRVNKKLYTGNNITASDVYQKTRGSANTILKKYPVGGEVSVYYNPANPDNSVLETGMRRNVYIMLGAAAFCLFFAVVITVSELKKKLTSKKPESSAVV